MALMQFDHMDTRHNRKTSTTGNKAGGLARRLPLMFVG